MHPNLDTRTAPRSMNLGGFFTNVMQKPTTRKRKTVYGKERERKPPSTVRFTSACRFFFFFFFQWYCLLINDCYDDSPERSSVGWEGWLDAPMSNLIWGPQPSSSLHFSCFQFGLCTCAAPAIYITMNISCCGLFFFCCTLAAAGLPVCSWFMCLCHDCVNALESFVNAADIRSVFQLRLVVWLVCQQNCTEMTERISTKLGRRGLGTG